MQELLFKFVILYEESSGAGPDVILFFEIVENKKYLLVC